MPARQDFASHLAKQALLPMYALVGNERLLVIEAVATLRDRVLTQAADFNKDEFSAANANLEQVVAAARTLPMMAPKRWVLLSDAHKLKEKSIALLEDYAKNPSPDTVFCLAGEKLDLRTKLSKQLLANKSVFALDAPKPYALPQWIKDRGQKRGIAIERPAAQLLVDLVGRDLGVLDITLDKLYCFAGKTNPIQAQHVEDLVAPTKMESIFELTHSVGTKNLSKAVLEMRNILGGGEPALLVLRMVARQFRLLIRTKALLGQRVSIQDLPKQLGVPSFVAEKLKRQANAYQTNELLRSLDVIAKTDIRLKSSSLKPPAIMNQLLVDLLEFDAYSSA